MPFDYTGKKIVSIGEYEKLIDNEIRRVKALTYQERVASKWAGVRNRPKGSLWLDDDLTELNGIGAALFKKFEKQGITKVRELSMMDENELSNLAIAMKVSLNRLETIQTKCMTSQPGTSPFPQNYDYVEGQSNPYLCRYGELL